MRGTRMRFVGAGKGTWADGLEARWGGGRGGLEALELREVRSSGLCVVG